jgi:predicted  nucleic acid-binding Zn-ribbon protein
MTGNVDSLIIEHLKALRNEIRDFRSRYEEDHNETRDRLAHIETGLAALRRDFAHADENTALLSIRMDRINQRIERIEKRLELS